MRRSLPRSAVASAPWLTLLHLPQGAEFVHTFVDNPNSHRVDMGVVIGSNAISHLRLGASPLLLSTGDVLVQNDTRVATITDTCADCTTQFSTPLLIDASGAEMPKGLRLSVGDVISLANTRHVITHTLDARRRLVLSPEATPGRYEDWSLQRKSSLSGVNYQRGVGGIQRGADGTWSVEHHHLCPGDSIVMPVEGQPMLCAVTETNDTRTLVLLPSPDVNSAEEWWMLLSSNDVSAIVHAEIDLSKDVFVAPTNFFGTQVRDEPLNVGKLHHCTSAQNAQPLTMTVRPSARNSLILPGLPLGPNALIAVQQTSGPSTDSLVCHGHVCALHAQMNLQ